MNSRLSSACVAMMLLAASARAQWSGDPGVNLALGDRTGEQTQVLIAPTADGGAYVSWFDNSTGGYDVYLQRLDAGGNEQWAHNGVLIADRSFSSTQAYDLAVDTTGYAVLAFRDDRPVGIQITATRVDDTGTQVWGPGGVQMTGTTARRIRASARPPKKAVIVCPIVSAEIELNCSAAGVSLILRK